MNEEIRDALSVDMTVDITTTGRRSGGLRRIEIWSHYFDDRVILTGSPGKRSWYANLVANPEFTYHLKERIQADLPATAKPITDEDERRSVLTRLKEVSAYRQGQPMDVVEDWVRGSCLVEVTLKLQTRRGRPAVLRRMRCRELLRTGWEC